MSASLYTNKNMNFNRLVGAGSIVGSNIHAATVGDSPGAISGLGSAAGMNFGAYSAYAQQPAPKEILSNNRSKNTDLKAGASVAGLVAGTGTISGAGSGVVGFRVEMSAEVGLGARFGAGSDDANRIATSIAGTSSWANSSATLAIPRSKTVSDSSNVAPKREVYPAKTLESKKVSKRLAAAPRQGSTETVKQVSCKRPRYSANAK